MKAKNANLQKAKKEANDEFYTQYEGIAKEIERYKKPPRDEKPVNEAQFGMNVVTMLVNIFHLYF